MMERGAGIEPASSAWKAEAQPIGQPRIAGLRLPLATMLPIFGREHGGLLRNGQRYPFRRTGFQGYAAHAAPTSPFGSYPKPAWSRRLTERPQSASPQRTHLTTILLCLPLLLGGCELATGAAIGLLGANEAETVFVVSREPECAAYRPIYLSEEGIAVLPRPDKEQIATHNRVFEERCPEAR